jgi:hypothetical protein
MPLPCFSGTKTAPATVDGLFRLGEQAIEPGEGGTIQVFVRVRVRRKLLACLLQRLGEIIVGLAHERRVVRVEQVEPGGMRDYVDAWVERLIIDEIVKR